MSTLELKQREQQSSIQWFTTPLGRYLIECEYQYFDNEVADVFGYNAFQLGLPEYDFLRSSRIPLKCRVDPSAGVELRAEFRDLPIATNSVDLLILPHALEFSPYPHQILREVQRVLMPEGHAIIACFNPRSLWGLRRLLMPKGPAYPWTGRFLALPRLKDWLALLELEVAAGKMACYLPPCTQDKWIQRFGFMERAAQHKWWPFGGGVYFLHVIKRVRGMRVIMPIWREQLERKRNLAIVPKATDRDEPAAARKPIQVK